MKKLFGTLKKKDKDDTGAAAAPASPALGRRHEPPPPADLRKSQGADADLDPARTSQPLEGAADAKRSGTRRLGGKKETPAPSATSTPSMSRLPASGGNIPTLPAKTGKEATAPAPSSLAHTSHLAASLHEPSRASGARRSVLNIDEDDSNEDSPRGAAALSSAPTPATATAAPASAGQSAAAAAATATGAAASAKRRPSKAGPRRTAPRKTAQERTAPFNATDSFRQLEATGRDESSELDAQELPADMADAFRVLPLEVFRAFADLREVARDANTQLVTPEFVILGLKGHGKSSVMEAILGWPVLHVDFDVATRRPLHVTMQNNLQYADEPRFTLMSDPGLGIHKRAVLSNVTAVRTEIHSRVSMSQDLVRTPVQLLIEHAEAVNMVLIECPGLSATSADDAAASLAMDLARPVHRTLVVVHECAEWDALSTTLTSTVLRLDPALSRTIFVNTKLHTFSQGLYNPADLTRYFSGMARLRPLAASFWVTTLSLPCRAACTTGAQYRRRLAQAWQRDMRVLRALQGDRNVEPSVGVLALRGHLLRRAVAQVRAAVPHVLCALNRSEEATARSLAELSADSERLTDARSRASGLAFVDGFLASLQDGIQGTLHLDPEQYGETVAEECAGLASARWVDDQARPLVAGEASSSRLVGGQQFQRLQHELTTLLSSLSLDSLPAARDYALPTGSLSKGDAQRAAAHMVHTVLVRSLRPVFAQALARAEHILLHAFSVYDEGHYGIRVDEPSADADWLLLAQSPAFRALLRDKYHLFVQAKLRILARELEEDLLSVDTLMWRMTTDPKAYAPVAIKTGVTAKTIDLAGAKSADSKSPRGHLPPTALNAELQAELARVEKEQLARQWTPQAVAKRLLAVHARRLALAVPLKMYRHLLDSLFQELLDHLRGQVAGLSRDEVALLFDASSVRQQYGVRREELHRALARLGDTKGTYATSSQSFLRYVSALP